MEKKFKYKYQKRKETKPGHNWPHKAGAQILDVKI